MSTPQITTNRSFILILISGSPLINFFIIKYTIFRTTKISVPSVQKPLEFFKLIVVLPLRAEGFFTKICMLFFKWNLSCDYICVSLEAFCQLAHRVSSSKRSPIIDLLIVGALTVYGIWVCKIVRLTPNDLYHSWRKKKFSYQIFFYRMSFWAAILAPLPPRSFTSVKNDQYDISRTVFMSRYYPNMSLYCV